MSHTDTAVPAAAARRAAADRHATYAQYETQLRPPTVPLSERAEQLVTLPVRALRTYGRAAVGTLLVGAELLRVARRH